MIVGVGASAGGLEAYTQLLRALPPDSGLAVVLVQHLSPTEESSLAALLASHTTMPVVEVTNGVHVEANKVYVIPPNARMQMTGDRLVLSPRPTDRTQHTPIDTFFTSLAAAADARAIAVVLSGTASDGALGVREVKAAGGITFAQTPGSAKYDSMPRAAIGTGMVDVVMTPEEIGAELGRIARHPYVPSVLRFRDALEIREDQLQRIFELLRASSNVDFRHYKTPTVYRRLMRRMALHRITDVDGYIKLLQANPVEVRALFEDLLIHVTRFFREPESFDALITEVLPHLVQDRGAHQPLRVWVCGCATGEEAYSVAIVLLEFLEKNALDLRVQIFATDVSETAIDHARAGIYSSSIAADVGHERLRRFFVRTDGSYRVNKLIRDMCVFARQDITRDPPFSRIDLVMCRNVLIYMDAVLQRKLITLFHYALRPDGYLVLGQAETVGSQAALFALSDKKHRIHVKKNTAAAARELSAIPVDHPALVPRRRPLATTGVESTLHAEVNRLILDRYAPAGVVVDSDLQILQFRGQTGPFLEPAPGEASLSLLKMVREGLLHPLRTAVEGARKSLAPVRKTGLRVRTDQGWQQVAIEVIPLNLARQHFVVMFERAGSPEADAAPPAKPGRGRKEGGTTAMLRRELAASRQYLQSIIQELEAANEELQSANEEILSSNEELQSTNEELDTAKEELQSTNEELNTLNDELQSRNDEMSRINSDLINLVGSVQIAIVIVNGDLRIKRFTPMAEKVMNLIPSDLDRSIGHINPNLDCPNLEALVRECVETVTPIEREVRDRQGKWYSLRVRPYKNTDNKIDGAVIALLDIDILKRSEQRAQNAQAHAETIVRYATEPVALLDNALHVQLSNSAFADLLNVDPEKLRGRIPSDVGGLAWGLDEWQHVSAEQLGTPLPTVTIKRKGAPPLGLSGRIVPAIDGGDPLILVTVDRAIPGKPL